MSWNYLVEPRPRIHLMLKKTTHNKNFGHPWCISTYKYRHILTQWECLCLYDVAFNKAVQQQFLLLLLSYTGSLTYYITLCFENKINSILRTLLKNKKMARYWRSSMSQRRHLSICCLFVEGLSHWEDSQDLETAKTRASGKQKVQLKQSNVMVGF